MYRLYEFRTLNFGEKMANNLFISYDLNSPGQDYSKVIEAIKGLGGRTQE